jgi:hypothetical protein
VADVTSTPIAAPVRARLVVELMDDGSVKVTKEGEVCLLWRYLATVVATAQAA